MYQFVKILLERGARRVGLKMGAVIDGERKYVSLGRLLTSYNISCLRVEQFKKDLGYMIIAYTEQYRHEYPEFFHNSNVRLLIEIAKS